jgi:hypothetical protein
MPEPDKSAAPTQLGGREIPSNSSRPGVVHLASDLLLTSRVAQVCRQRQVPYRVVGSLQQLTPSREPLGTLLIDLQAPGWNADAYRQATQQSPLATRVIAYAQHVETDLLAAAADLGFETVMTRGQFDARFPQLLPE